MSWLSRLRGAAIAYETVACPRCSAPVTSARAGMPAPWLLTLLGGAVFTSSGTGAAIAGPPWLAAVLLGAGAAHWAFTLLISTPRRGVPNPPGPGDSIRS